MLRPGLAVLFALFLSQVALADAYEFDATLSLEFAGGSSPDMSASGIAEVGSAGGSLMSLSLPGSMFTGTGTFSVGTSMATVGGVSYASLQYQISGHGPGLFTGIDVRSTQAAATMPLQGSLRLCAIGGCATSLSLPINGVIGGSMVTGTFGAPDTILVGGPGLQNLTSMFARSNYWTVPPPWLASQITVMYLHTTSSGFDLTFGTVMQQVSTLIPGAFAHGPVSNTTGSTAEPGGVIQLVTPFAVVSDATGSLTGNIGAARLTVELIPEPSHGLLLTAGAATLWMLGLRSRR